MVGKGVLVGSAAALVLAVAFVAGALVSRPHEAHPAPTAAAPRPKVKITLVAPKEPPALRGGPKLETVPPGAPDSPQAVPARPPPPPADRLEPRSLEPEPADDDFLDGAQRDYADRYPAEPYRERRERWRERRYEEDWQDEDRYGPVQPYEPPPPPWWRR